MIMKIAVAVVLVGLVLAGPVVAGESKAARSSQFGPSAVKWLFTRAIIGQGKLLGISGTTLRVEKDSKTYTVLTGVFDKCTTRIVRRFGSKTTSAEMTVGDTVGVTGRWQDEAKTTIEACVVRDLSMRKRHVAFVGKVVSLTNGGFVMTTVSNRRPDQTVTVGTGTKIVNRKEEVISLADVKVGHRVRVKGWWDNNTNTITEVTHVKDYNLPVVPVSTP